jgi:tryptophan synthase alpha subunit
VDGVLVTDMIVEEAGEYLAEMARVGLAPIFLAAPTSPDERLEAIATHSKGFVYAISRVGITGTQQSPDLGRSGSRLRASGDGPSCRWPWGSASPTRNTSPRWRSSRMPRSLAARLSS